MRLYRRPYRFFIILLVFLNAGILPVIASEAQAVTPAPVMATRYPS